MPESLATIADCSLADAGIDDTAMEAALVAAHTASFVIRAFTDRSNHLQLVLKGDGSPATCADVAADGLITRLIQHCFPNDAIFSEEERSRSLLSGTADFVWIVDPLDGTREFVRGNQGHYCISLARLKKVDENRFLPVCGVICDPHGVTYAAIKGKGVWSKTSSQHWTQLQHVPPGMEWVLIDNASSSNLFVETLRRELGGNIRETVRQGSALKIQPLVTSSGAFYIRPSIQQEWDYAALALMASEAGLVVTDCLGKELSFRMARDGLVNGVLIAPRELFVTVKDYAIQQFDTMKFADLRNEIPR